MLWLISNPDVASFFHYMNEVEEVEREKFAQINPEEYQEKGK